jgi:IS30 family transposase
MAEHDRLRIDAGIQVYVCDPQSPWQCGTNENTNGLLRQYFPKGTDLSIHSMPTKKDVGPENAGRDV